MQVTRILWRKYKILHRDISPNNVLLRDESKVISHESLPVGLGDICFSEYLLDAGLPVSSSQLAESTMEPDSVLPQAKESFLSPHLRENTETQVECVFPVNFIRAC